MSETDTISHIRIVRRLFIVGMVVAVSLMGIALSRSFMEGGIQSLLINLALALPAVWVFTAGARWWLAMPVAVAFGGMFFFGFRVYIHEIVLPLCLLALLPYVALRKSEGRLPREPLPFRVYALIVFFVAHWAYSVFVIKNAGVIGAGNVTRVYLQGLWALIFLVPFYWRGSTRFLSGALALIYAAYFLRAVIGIVVYYSEDFFYIPYLNFIFSSSQTGLVDLRFSCVQLLLLSLAYANLSRSWLYRLFHLVAALVALWLVLLSGGRVSLGMLCVIPLVWAVVYRKFGWFAVGTTFLLLVMVVINRNPQLIYRFPEQAQRALSVLVSETPYRRLDWHERVKGSNEWHQRLAELGFQRWTASGATLLAGNRVEPFDEQYYARGASMEMKAMIASRVGTYESGLWVLLAVLGLTGLGLYAGVFHFLLKDVVRALWRERICDVAHIYYFIAVTEMVIWVLFCWIAGGFPSYELLMAAIAKAAYEDQRAAPAEPAPEAAGAA